METILLTDTTDPAYIAGYILALCWMLWFATATVLVPIWLFKAMRRLTAIRDILKSGIRQKDELP